MSETYTEYRIEHRRKDEPEAEWKPWSIKSTFLGDAPERVARMTAEDQPFEYRLVQRTLTYSDWEPLHEHHCIVAREHGPEQPCLCTCGAIRVLDATEWDLP